MLHNARDSTEKLAPVAHQHVSAPGEGAVFFAQLRPLGGSGGVPVCVPVRASLRPCRASVL